MISFKEEHQAVSYSFKESQVSYMSKISDFHAVLVLFHFNINALKDMSQGHFCLWTLSLTLVVCLTWKLK